MAINDESFRKLVGMLIEVLHGEYSDTRDLAVVQLSILGNRAIPFISSFLEQEAEKENDMIKYFQLYQDWRKQYWVADKDEREFRSVYVQGWNSDMAKKKLQLEEVWQKSAKHTRELEILWQKFASDLIEKYQIRDTYFNSLTDESPQYFAEKIEQVCGGVSRRRAIEGALNALSIIDDEKVMPLLERLPVYQFPYENKEDSEQSLKSVFSKAKAILELMRKRH
jgi:hypothetical protein